MFNVTFYDDDTGLAYRVRVKRLTVGDAVQADMLGDEIAGRDDLTGRVLLALAQVYPFLKYATAICERAPLDAPPVEKLDSGDPAVPDDAAWETFDLTEAVFLDLPELLVLRWQYEAIQKNPHRDPAYEALKKKLLMAAQQAASAPSMNESDSAEKTGG